jgi:hypothetical protein
MRCRAFGNQSKSLPVFQDVVRRQPLHALLRRPGWPLRQHRRPAGDEKQGAVAKLSQTMPGNLQSEAGVSGVCHAIYRCIFPRLLYPRWSFLKNPDKLEHY